MVRFSVPWFKKLQNTMKDEKLVKQLAISVKQGCDQWGAINKYLYYIWHEHLVGDFSFCNGRVAGKNSDNIREKSCINAWMDRDKDSSTIVSYWTIDFTFLVKETVSVTLKERNLYDSIYNYMIVRQFLRVIKLKCLIYIHISTTLHRENKIKKSNLIIMYIMW